MIGIKCHRNLTKAYQKKKKKKNSKSFIYNKSPSYFSAFVYHALELNILQCTVSQQSHDLTQ